MIERYEARQVEEKWQRIWADARASEVATPPESARAETPKSYVLEQLGSARPVMVGDRYHDVEGAAEHNIDCVGVRWGYASTPDELEKAGARWIVEHPKEIFDIVRGEVVL